MKKELIKLSKTHVDRLNREQQDRISNLVKRRKIMVLNRLIGTTIYAILMNSKDPNEQYAAEHTILIFDTDKGTFAFETTGDCCSCSYFQEILNPEQILNKTITEVSTMELDKENPARYEDKIDEQGDLTQFYGYKIRVEDGFCDLIFRNESNGYYGGDLEEYVLPIKTLSLFAIHETWMAD
jgi:hypothetical protein